MEKLMKIRSSSRLALTLAVPATLALLVAGGCSSKPKPATEASAKAAPAPTPAPVAVAPESTPAPAPAEAAELVGSIDELNRRGYLVDALFDFDQYAIRLDQRAALDRDATWLRKQSSVKILVEGHCDERGTAQYNMALGERRAQAVKDYLAGLGVDSSRIQVVSYGKERPFASGHDENAWAENRRGHFLVTAR